MTFIPLNLLVQFSKMANCYFLLLVLLEYIPAVYTPGGPASMIMPLAFVILVSMVKDIIEDRSRYLSDQEENNSNDMSCNLVTCFEIYMFWCLQ